ncbi:MAG: tetratricopeptide repeat protein [Candidatus Omnitrophota bacterium]
MEKSILRRIARFVFIYSIFLSAILINPNCIYAASFSEEAESYRAKGYDAQENGDVDTAIEWYQKAIGLDPRYAAPHNDLGILFETKGWLDRAESEYQKAIAISPEYKDAHTNLALLYERKGELEKAAFHWMRRYKLGKPGETWTNEAVTRLQKLGLIDIKEPKPKAAAEPEKPAKSKATEQQAPAKKQDAKKTETRVKEVKPVKKTEEKKPKKASRWTRIGTQEDKKDKQPERKKAPRKTAEKKIKAPPAAKRNIDKELEESLKLAEQRLREEKKTKDSKPAVKAKPAGGSNVYYSRARDYYSKGEYSRALDEIRSGKNNFPEDRALLALEEDVKIKMKEERIEDLYSDGMTRYRQKDFDGAKKDFESILNILPE